jgi:hypothetical protein
LYTPQGPLHQTRHPPPKPLLISDFCSTDKPRLFTPSQ